MNDQLIYWCESCCSYGVSNRVCPHCSNKSSDERVTLHKIDFQSVLLNILSNIAASLHDIKEK